MIVGGDMSFGCWLCSILGVLFFVVNNKFIIENFLGEAKVNFNWTNIIGSYVMLFSAAIRWICWKSMCLCVLLFGPLDFSWMGGFSAKLKFPGPWLLKVGVWLVGDVVWFDGFELISIGFIRWIAVVCASYRVSILSFINTFNAMNWLSLLLSTFVLLSKRLCWVSFLLNSCLGWCICPEFMS